MLPCVNCQTLNEETARFCSACGLPLEAGGESGGVPVRTARVSLEVRLRDDTTPAGRLVHAAFQRLVEGNLADALLGLESAFALDPDLWSAHLLRSVILLQQGDVDGAEEHFRRAAQLEPDAVYHKATLERILADNLRPSWSERILEKPGRLPMLLGAGAAALVLVLGVAFSAIVTRHGHRHPSVSPGGVPTNGIPVGLQPNVTYAPTNQPVAPPPAYRFPAPSYPPAEETSPPTASQPGEQMPGNVGILPPAQPFVGTVPDLVVKEPQGSAGSEPAGPASQQSSAGSQPPRQGREASPGQTPARPRGRAYVGYEPNPPPPPLVRPQQAPTIPSPQRADGSIQDGGAEAGEEDRPPQVSGRELQRLAMQSERQGRREEAAQYYRQAIEAYRQDAAAGKDVESARRGIASCQAALNLLEAGL